MNLDKMSSIFSRLFLAGAFLLLMLAVLEKLVNLNGYTILRSYEPGRLLEFASIMLFFVIAILMRQIREGLKKT